MWNLHLSRLMGLWILLSYTMSLFQTESLVQMRSCRQQASVLASEFLIDWILENFSFLVRLLTLGICKWHTLLTENRIIWNPCHLAVEPSVPPDWSRTNTKTSCEISTECCLQDKNRMKMTSNSSRVEG